MKPAEWTSLAVFSGLMAMFIADKAHAVPSKRADYLPRMVELGGIKFPHGRINKIRGGIVVDSNVRDSTGHVCKRQPGHDDDRVIVFEECKKPR